MSTDTERDEMWREILRTAWLIREADIDGRGASSGLAQQDMQELDLRSLGPMGHCVADAKILAHLIDSFDKANGGGGLDGEMSQ